MERMQTSGEQATAAAAAEGSDDFLAELLKQMQSGGLEGEGSEEEFSKMLMGMMEQLTHKDILYEPMKELHEKFPGWLEKNRAATSKEDLERYELQQKLVSEIVAKFEEPNYADTSKEHHEYIVDRMQKVRCPPRTRNPFMMSTDTRCVYRCKMPASPPTTWSETCPPPKISTFPTINAPLNNCPNKNEKKQVWYENVIRRQKRWAIF